MSTPRKRTVAVVPDRGEGAPGALRRAASVEGTLAHASRRLEGAGLHFRMCWSWSEVLAVGTSCDVALVEVRRLDRPEALARLESLQERCPGLPVVLVTEGSLTNLKHLRHVTMAEVVFHSELDRLPEFLESVSRFRGREYLVQRIRESGLHLRLQQALLHLVRQLREEVRWAGPGGSSFPRNVKALAESEGISASWLSTLASREGIPLRRFLSGVLALQVLELMARGKELAQVAALMGYESPGALSNRVKRTFGRSPSELLREGRIEARYTDVAALLPGTVGHAAAEHETRQ